MKTRLILLLVAIALWGCSKRNRLVSEASYVPFAMAEPDSISTEDRNFILEAASGSMLEMQLGKIAQENSQNTAVKNFGAMMVREHSAIQEELKTMTRYKDLPIPAGLLPSDQAILDSLKTKAGAAFDLAYINLMVTGHKKTMEAFEKQAEKGKDADISSFATKTYPVLNTHLDSALAVQHLFK